MMTKIIFIFALILIPAQSFAASAWVEVNLTGLRTSIDAGNAYVFFEPLDPGVEPSNCGLLDQGTIATTADWKVVHSLVLAALLADKPLTVLFSGCQGTKPKITSVEIHK